MHHNFKRGLTALLLGIALALPSSALAATSTTTTSESVTIASTVSMVAPATATYAFEQSFDGSVDGQTTYIVVTVLSSNNPSGITTSATVDPYVTAGNISVATSRRLTLLSEIDCTSPNQVIGGTFHCPANGVATASGAALTKSASVLNRGTFADSSTSVTLASSTGALANADLGVEFGVSASDFPVGGEYTSGVHWTTSTNP